MEPVDTAQSGEPTTDTASLGERQFRDPQLRSILQYLIAGELPTDERQARQIVLGQSSFTVLDNVLYHIEDKTLRIVPPECDRHQLFREAHEGVFSGHLRQAKIHSQLSGGMG